MLLPFNILQVFKKLNLIQKKWMIVKKVMLELVLVTWVSVE